MKKIYIFTILAIIFIAFFGLKTNKSSENIVIGAVFPMTGGLASIGEELRNGVDLAVKKTGLTIQIEDGQADPQKSLTAGQSLVNIQNVPIILTAFRGASLSLASNLRDRDVIVFSTTATTEGKVIATTSDNFFVIGAEMVSAGRVPGKYARVNNLCTIVGLISEQSDTGRDKIAGFMEGIGRDKVIVTEFFQPNETDFRTIVTKLKSKNVDCIFVEIRSNSLSVLLSDMDKQVFYPKIFANSYSITPKGLSNSPAKQVANIIFSSTAFDTSNPATNDFITLYKNTYGIEPTDFAAIGYEMVNMISRPIKKCKSDTECLKAQMSIIKDYNSAIGSVTIDSNKEIKLTEYDLFRVTDGRISKIEQSL